MGNPNVPNTKISEKEMEKAKEKTMKMMGLPLSTIFFHGNDRAILKNITPMGSTLIPRDIYTNIIVYPMTTHDGHMIRKFDQKNASSSRPRTTVPPNKAAGELNDAIRSNILDEAKLRNKLISDPSLCTSYNHGGYTPLSYAAFKGFTGTVSYILEKHPTILDNPEAFPIHKACEGGHLDILKMFHEKRGDRSFFNADRKGRTPLHVACRAQAPAPAQIFKYLIKLPGGRDAMHAKDENGETPRRVA